MLTAVVLAKNEANNIGDCLKTLEFCDEVLVVDDDSVDETAQIAKKRGAKVLKHELNGDFAAAHNWALDQIKSGWVLFVDADERITSALANEIKNSINKIEYKGFLIPRKDKMWGKTLKYGDVWGTKALRLARKGAGEWAGPVHESWVVDGRVGVLRNPILHNPHETMVEFLEHINDYSTIKADYFYKQKRQIGLLEITCGPIWRFIKAYVLRLGFLDGTAGFVHAMTMSFYTFLVAGKLYLRYKGIPK